MAQESSSKSPSLPAPILGSEFPWSNIEEKPVYLEKLELLSHSQDELRQNCYVFDQLTQAQITKKLRCLNCFGRSNKPTPELGRTRPPPPPPTPAKTGNTNGNNAKGKRRGDQNPARPMCSYHPGKLEEQRTGSSQARPQKIWSCCSAQQSEPGCLQEDTHKLAGPDNVHILKHYHYHPAPLASAQIKNGKTMRPAQTTSKAKAIALDCEMGVSKIGEPELIRVTAVDLFTRATLIDNLVSPSVPMAHFSTRYSGVTWTDMDKARRARTCFFGRDSAREALWKFVDQDTIVVAHSGYNDLNALRWLHSRVIDTFMLERYTGVKMDGGHSLKNLCNKRLGLSIQNGLGHDSLEDALACRELLHWWASSIPDV